MYVSEEQIAAAREWDLYSYLARFEPDELVRTGRNSYRMRTHDSLKITNGMWYWWSHGIGGRTALDYLIKVQGMTFPEAVTRLAGETPDFSPAFPVERKAKPAEERIFALPEKNDNNRRVFAYLSGRGIDGEILRECMRTGLLYEAKEYHNCVFVGYDGEEAKYGALRGSITGSSFKGDVAVSDRQYCFSFPREMPGQDTVYVFEGAIDALSYLTILKQAGGKWRETQCLSLGGVSGSGEETELPQALSGYLNRQPNIRRVVLCLDRDQTGLVAAKTIKRLLGDAYEVQIRPPQFGKDYNEQLVKGIERQERREKREKLREQNTMSR